MSGLSQDLRYALRQLSKSPRFTAIAAITLALGIGMNTAVFSVVDAAALRLPFQHPEQLFVLANSYSESDHTPTSFPDFQDWRAQNHSFTQLVASFRSSFNLTGVEEPQRIRGRYVSQGYFGLLGAQPLLGRSFLPAEHAKGGPNVCLISQDFWRRQFSADSGVLHLAMALGTPTFSFFRQNDGLQEWIARGPKHQYLATPCQCIENSEDLCQAKGKAQCLSAISPQQSLKRIEPLLAAAR